MFVDGLTHVENHENFKKKITEIKISTKSFLRFKPKFCFTQTDKTVFVKQHDHSRFLNEGFMI